MAYTRLLDDRVVLVSGGTMGVGAATAIAAAQAGARAVVISGRRPSSAEATLERIRAAGAAARYVQADVTHVEEAIASVTETVAAYGRIDCLVNAAAVVDRGTLLETTPEFFDWHVNVNLKAPFFTMQAAVQDMVDRGEPGSIVNILSTSMHVGQPILAAYVASKGGLAHVTKNAAHAHRFDRIRINGLNIGWTITEGEDVIQRKAHGAEDGWYEKAAATMPMGKLGQPDEIADFIVFLLSDRSGVVTGSIIDWDQNVIGALD
ncbi:MAG: SDR family oxidoreductase [Candidatus Nanopelagicales bacterium]|jgi:NAD(P)-dependent dehydrogenase (short-subunit alcohol dehydrogenase family)